MPAVDPAAAAPMNPCAAIPGIDGRRIVGRLSGRTLDIPATATPPAPEIAGGLVIHDGAPAPGFGRIGESIGYPDSRSFLRRFGLLLPATNTTMEHELWTLLRRSADACPPLDGVGIHASNVVTPVPRFGSPAELAAYGRQFVAGLGAAIDQARLAHPHYLIMGMSLEHILAGLEPIRALVSEVEARSGYAMATWADAAHAALARFSARRIGLLTPFEAAGNRNAARLFTDLGYEVVSTVGFACARAEHIAHVPDWAKERAITELLARPAHRLDAVVQCGTNLGLAAVIERLEPRLGMPILGINATLLWYALRETGVSARLPGIGRLGAEH